MKQDSEEFRPVGNAIFSLHTFESPTWSRLELELKKVPGIADVNLNYAADVVQVKFDPAKVTSEDIRTIMKKLGNALR
jgi:allophanate hydrolase subunit 1